MEEKVKIQIGKDLLVGTLFYPNRKGKHKTIIFLNGKGGTKERFYSMAKSFLEKGYVSFCFDFRGRGDSKTKTTPLLKYQLEDLKKAIKYVTKLPFVRKNDLTLVGTSMGGYVALVVASEFGNIKRMFLFEPALLLPEVENKSYLDLSNKDIQKAVEGDSKKIRAVEEIRKYGGELFLIVHEKSKYLKFMNETVDILYKNAVKAKRRKKLIVKGVGHAIFRTPWDQLKAKRLLLEYL